MATYQYSCALQLKYLRAAHLPCDGVQYLMQLLRGFGMAQRKEWMDEAERLKAQLVKEEKMRLREQKVAVFEIAEAVSAQQAAEDKVCNLHSMCFTVMHLLEPAGDYRLPTCQDTPFSCSQATLAMLSERVTITCFASCMFMLFLQRPALAA